MSKSHYTVICQTCGKPAGMTGLVCTEMACVPFEDKDGMEHTHDWNSHAGVFKCSDGHKTTIKIDPPECSSKCGFGSPAGTYYHSYRWM